MDTEQLMADILLAVNSDESLLTNLENPRWTCDDNGLYYIDSHVYVLDVNDLHLRVLRAKHDHPTVGHFGCNKTLDLVRQDYS